MVSHCWDALVNVPSRVGKTAPSHSPASVAKAIAPRRARSDAERHAKERAILDGALEVFAESGFAEARLEDVAARAGVAKGTIYLYFPSKQALFEALIRTGIAAPIEAAGAGIAGADLPFEAIVRALFMRMRRQILETRRKEIIRLVIAESGRFPELTQFYYREVVARGMALLRSVAERAAARGELTSDELARFPQLIVAPGLVAFLWATLFERFEKLDAEALLDTHLALLMRALKAKP
ncbi:MAG: TetR/AcrR family transcriptional regulator [Microvirga sp.]|nr:TetR/AcrR family transcriptional regulator [Microvirga sp.]